ncbi:hypothetical protein [Streptomyces liliifuscus]|uniref:Uncharacterized protein n=1 Tax=Streptomyces liliifuscus TaxID=2797636 RepID=A0A7T7L2G7_9ACTN|nr:hypothetical protein [Streptomyces liliifuscus]QQM45246.1 hypothetical protein JEQ17_41450 [Streptomyces liliifuscus]
MDRQQILDLYDWQLGVCFRHPGKGAVSTAIVKTIRPRGEEGRDVRACAECVIAIEDMRRETAARRESEDLTSDSDDSRH